MSGENIVDKKVLVLDYATGELQLQQADHRVFGLASTDVAVTDQELLAAEGRLEGYVDQEVGALSAKVGDTDALTIPADGEVEAVERTVVEAITALEGAVADLDAASGTSIDAVRDAAGLESNYTYKANEAAEYISTATTLKEADDLLDAALKAAEEDLNGKIDQKVAKAGDVLTGDLDMSGGSQDAAEYNTIKNIRTPVAPHDAANKGYVDSVAQGLSVKPAVLAATTEDLGAVYDNGVNGVGSTLTVPAVADFKVDGVSITEVGQGILVKSQTNKAENGRYQVKTVGGDSDAWVLERCSLNDDKFEIPSAFIFVQSGDTFGSTGWALVVDNAVDFKVGVDAITPEQFSGAGTFSAGQGLELTGTEFKADIGDGLEFVQNDIAVKVAEGSALSVAATGIDLDVAEAGGLEVASGELKIKAGSVTNAMLTNDSVTVGGVEVELGEGITVDGLGAISVSENDTEDGLEISVADASTTAKGVASFESTQFEVTSGAVELNSAYAQILDAAIDEAVTEGSLLIKGEAGWETIEQSDLVPELALNDLTDVELVNVADGDVVVFNAAGELENKAVGSASGVQAHSAKLDEYAAHTAKGLLAVDGEGDLASVEVEGSEGRIVVTDGAAADGNISVDLAKVNVIVDEEPVSVAGEYSKVQVDAYGRVIGGTSDDNANVTYTELSTGALAAGTAVRVASGGAVEAADKASSDVIGFVLSEGKVAINGVVEVTGVEAGKTYFLGENGAITDTAPATGYIVVVGTAINDDQLLIKFGTPVFVA